MKKILVVTEVFYPESGLINDFVEELQRKGYKVDVLTQHPSYPAGIIFTGYKNEYYSTEQWKTTTIHRFKLVEGYKTSIYKKVQNYWTFVKVGKKIARQIGNNYDHILIYQTGPLSLALPAVEIKKRFGKKLTIWTFDIWPDTVYAYGFPKIFPLRNFLKYIIQKVYKNCDNILVSSKLFVPSIQFYVPDKDIIYVPNWMIAEKQEQSNLRLSSDKFNFTFTGNISVSQNLKNVFLGWKIANLSNAILNIVGDGSYIDDLRAFIDKESIRGIVLHGRYPSNQIIDILKQSDTLILPLVANYGVEKTEPYKIQSYLQSGKPIMGVIKGGGQEIILENNLGLCADPLDIQDIALKFKDSIDFASVNAQRVALVSQELMNKRFNRTQIINKVLSIIDN